VLRVAEPCRALEVRASTPLGKRLLFPDLTDPAGLWKKK
jgi:hypothetical protein